MSEMEAPLLLRDVLAAEDFGYLPTDDLLFAILPLLRQVSALHERGEVAAINAMDVVRDAGNTLALRTAQGRFLQENLAAIDRVQPRPASALNVIGETRVTVESAEGTNVDNLLVLEGPDPKIVKPVYLPAFGSWELVLRHHDEITDIFQLGQILACLALGLDFNDPADLKTFASNRQNLFRINPRLSPVVAAVITEMTELNRYRRAKVLSPLIQKLETWRDQPVGLDLERLLAEAKGAVGRRTAVLEHLRDRLFDLSRRNRLVYFRPTSGSVNLTVASVPMVLRLESIRADQLATWQGSFAQGVLAGKPISLGQWLRFEDQPYLAPAMDRLIQEARRDRAEYGFSSLRLVVAFLRWHNLKEAPDERIVSPLLWLPVQLVKKKGVRDQYVLECADDEAEFNPALRHYLRQLYDIRLPETVDLGAVTLEQIHADIAAQIKRTEPGVELRLQTKPEIELIYQKAVQRIQQFQRRRGRSAAPRSGGVVRPDFSYERDDYRPLGLALFRQYIDPSPLPLRSAVGAPPKPRSPMMAPAESPPSTESTENLTYVLNEARGHRFAWDLDLTQVTLANFNYRKMSLVRDYNQLLDEGAPNAGFDSVFSIEPKPLPGTAPPPVPLTEQWTVVPSDTTQKAAIAVARAAGSFIIQGPPGTGKSQTITNLIADYAGRGQRVLFVCEKRAALDVVFHRLKSSGLDDLCCLIHDSQTDKKAFVADLKAGYEQWAGKPNNLEAVRAARDRAVQGQADAVGRLQWFESAMQSVPESLAGSVRGLIRRLIELPAPDAAIGPAQREALPEYAVWRAHRDLTGRLARLVQDRLGAASLAAHPFARLDPALVASERAFAEAETKLGQAEPLLDDLGETLDSPDRLANPDTSFGDALAIARAAALIDEHQLSGRLALLDPASAESAALRAEFDALAVLDGKVLEAGKGTAHWREKLAPEDASAALDIARRQEPSLLRFFSPAWWRLTGELKRRYDLGQHAVRPTWTRVLELLAAERAAEAARDEATEAARLKLQAQDLGAFQAAIAALTQLCQTEAGARALIAHLAGRADPAASARVEAAGKPQIIALDQALTGLMQAPRAMSLAALGEWVRDVREGLEDLPDLIPLLKAMDQAAPVLAQALRTIAKPLPGIEALIATESLSRLLRADPDLARFDGEALAASARKAAAAERATLEHNAAYIRAARQRLFQEHVRDAMLSVTQLDEAGKRFKKVYSNGRRELEHQFSLTMRHRSIRELASGDSGKVIDDLKPIWLMSPLSVSDTLPLDPDLFDVVIFDEASQIPTEDAVPALSRARQIVVVGDEMQLPPTSFFSATRDEADTEVIAEEDGERIAINLDADNLLSQSARNLPATLLAWHYRSRHESLISFSNAAFYEGRLITIPDQRLNDAASGILSLASEAQDAGAQGVSAILDKPISYHRITDGVYLGRSNTPEARYIARLVREILGRETGHSLGIVAFSEAQQTEIESALEALATEDPAFATRLEQEEIREDDGQFAGLFVKNLENVQGDERDIIILSICYGPGPDGRMLMNFGPINQRGGEKRLNVIFSRAKHRMAVVATIEPEAITNIHNEGASALKTFLEFATASAAGEVERSQAILAGLNAGAQAAFAAPGERDALKSSLAEALRKRGHVVHENVGRSSFRCDLAIVGERAEDYALGILLDAPGAALADAHERYVLRPQVLRNFGWRVADVLSHDWLRNPKGVMDRLEAALAGAAEPDADEDDYDVDEIDDDDVDMSGEDLSEALTVSVIPEGAVVREFRFQQGSSNKFWRIAVAGGQVAVTFGRIGSAGQTNIKSYDAADRAAREAAKLIDEKLRKGYIEGAPNAPP